MDVGYIRCGVCGEVLQIEQSPRGATLDCPKKCRSPKGYVLPDDEQRHIETVVHAFWAEWDYPVGLDFWEALGDLIATQRQHARGGRTQHANAAAAT